MVTGELQALARCGIYPRELCGILTNGQSWRLLRLIRREKDEYSYILYKPHDLPVDQKPVRWEKRRYIEQVVTILAHMISISECVLKVCTATYRCYRAPYQSLHPSIKYDGGDVHSLEPDEDGVSNEGSREGDSSKGALDLQLRPIQDLTLSPPPSHTDTGEAGGNSSKGYTRDHRLSKHDSTHTTTSPSPSASPTTSTTKAGKERQSKMQPHVTTYEEYTESLIIPLTAKNLEKYAF